MPWYTKSKNWWPLIKTTECTQRHPSVKYIFHCFNNIYVCTSLCGSSHMYNCIRRGEEDKISEVGVTGGYDSSEMGADDQTKAFCKNSQNS